MRSFRTSSCHARSTIGRATAVAGTAAVVVLLGVTPTSAHVTVSSTDAAPGGFGKLVFRVPTESDTASTIGVTITLPADTPFAFVSVKPKPGWAVKTKTTKLDQPVTVGDFNLTEAVTKVTWTAKQGTDIAPGEFDEFEISAGPFPENAESMSFPAVQRYDDGEVVKWSQPVVQGEEEPEAPAPTLELGRTTTGEDAAAADEADEEAQTSDDEALTDDAGASTSTDAVDSSDTMARTLGAFGIGLGGLAVLLVVLRRRS